MTEFSHGDHVVILPLGDPPMRARVIDVHSFRTWTEYEVRWWVDSKPVTARVFEDELRHQTEEEMRR